MKNKHLKHILIILLISVMITFIFDYIYGGDSSHIVNILLNTLYGVIIGSSISLSGIISHFVINKYDILANPIKTYVILLCSIFLFITIDVLLVNALWYRYVLNVPFERIIRSSTLISSSIVTIFLGLTIFFIILSKTFMSKFLNAEKDKQAAIRDADMAKFETLKSQINPHFLFNSLNTLSTLILIDPNRADQFTAQLSSIYRYVLDNQDEDLVPVNKEIDFAKDYLELQSIRFSNNFTVSIEETKWNSEVMIIPLSLQLILENVFKHNIISQKNKVHISIGFEDSYIVIHNNKSSRKEIKESHSVGLSNILNRYELVSDDECKIEDKSNSFTVKLPLVFAE